MEKRLSSFFTSETAGKAGCIETAVSGAVRPGFPLSLPVDPVVTSLEYDSRAVKPGSLFFALPGLHADGHAFIAAALAAGAAVIVHKERLAFQEPLASRLAEYPDGAVFIRVKDSRFAMSPVADAFYDYPSRHLAVIGVTGTEGKSTTVYLIYQLLILLGRKAGFISTVKYSDGGEEQWNSEHQTTPEAVTIHRLLADMRDKGAEFAVLESSSHGLSPRTNRLGDVAFDAAVMTNVTHEHLEFHGSWEQYRHDKANLFRALDAFSHFKSLGREGAEPAAIPSFGVINADDKSAPYFAAATKARARTYSALGGEADLSLVSIESGVRGNRCRVRNTGADGTRGGPPRGGILDITDRLPGAFNVGNVLAALLTVSGILSVPVEDLVPLVPRLKPVRGRMTAVTRGQPFEVLVDYAHTPSSFDAIFPPLRERLDKTGGRIIALFGSAGERDTAKRPEQGCIAAHWSDLVVLTDEDPRGEEPLAILEEIAAGCPCRKRGEDLFLIPDRPTAIRKAFSLARPGDLVLLLGKGHENSIIYAKKTVTYDELTEAEQALTEMGYNGAPDKS